MMLSRRMLTRKTDPKTGKHTLREPAQSKRTWICAVICRKNDGLRSQGTRFVRVCVVETYMDISPEPFCVKINRENAGRPGEHLD